MENTWDDKLLINDAGTDLTGMTSCYPRCRHGPQRSKADRQHVTEANTADELGRLHSTVSEDVELLKADVYSML